MPDLGRAICYNNLASLYFKNANFDKALKYCRAAVALVEEYVKLLSVPMRNSYHRFIQQSKRQDLIVLA